MNVRQIVYDRIKSVAEQQHKKLTPLNDHVRMLECGLDSLCMAILVATLDDELDVNPFEADDAITPVTIGDFVRLYENARATADNA